MRVPPFMATLVAISVSASVTAQSPPAAGNAAATYKEAAAWWETHAQGESRTLTDEELGILADPFDPSSAAQRAAFEKVKPYVDLIRRAGHTATIERSLDYDQGFDLLLPHLSQMRNAARILRLDAQARMDAGDTGAAIESLRAITGISAHSKTDNILISSLVSAAVLNLENTVFREALDRGAIDATSAEAILKDLQRFAGNDPINLAEALLTESRMARASGERMLGTPEGASELASLVGGNDEVVEQLMSATPDEIRAQLDRYEETMTQASQAAMNPDRDAARAALAEIERAVESGEAGLAAQLLMPAFTKAAEVNWQVVDMLAERERVLRAIRDGTATAADHANAAVAYLRLAALVATLPEDVQREIETLRVARHALDDDQVERVRRHIAPMREAILRDFRWAATCKRCAFPTIDRDMRAPLLPPYMGSLRGALRVALADALAGPSPRGPDGRVRGSDVPPPGVAEAVGFGLKLAADLADDPRFGNALLAASVLDESSRALGESPSPLAASDRQHVADAVGRLDTGDLTGMREALTRERELLVEEFYGRYVRPDVKEAMLERLGHRDRNWLASVRFVGQVGRMEATAFESWSGTQLALPLCGAGDLLEATAPKRAMDLVLNPASRAVQTDDLLRSLLPLPLDPPPCDFVAAEQRADGAVAKLMDLTRGRP